MIKQLGIFSGLFFLAISIFPSCTNDNKDQLVPAVCDTVNMSYSRDIVPILESNCYGCHGNGNTGGSGGINLQDYNTLKGYALDGRLYANITHTSETPMPPPPAPKLPECEINKILDWINQGAPNN